MDKEIFYVSFPGMMMMTHQTPIPFEVVKEYDRAVRIRLLEDEPLIEGYEDLGSSPAGTEFVIARSAGRATQYDLLDVLRKGNVAPYYISREDLSCDPPIENFAGTFFGYNPNGK